MAGVPHQVVGGHGPGVKPVGQGTEGVLGDVAHVHGAEGARGDVAPARRSAVPIQQVAGHVGAGAIQPGEGRRGVADDRAVGRTAQRGRVGRLGVYGVGHSGRVIVWVLVQLSSLDDRLVDHAGDSGDGGAHRAADGDGAAFARGQVRHLPDVGGSGAGVCDGNTAADDTGDGEADRHYVGDDHAGGHGLAVVGEGQDVGHVIAGSDPTVGCLRLARRNGGFGDDQIGHALHADGQLVADAGGHSALGVDVQELAVSIINERPVCADLLRGGSDRQGDPQRPPHTGSQVPQRPDDGVVGHVLPGRHRTQRRRVGRDGVRNKGVRRDVVAAVHQRSLHQQVAADVGRDGRADELPGAGDGPHRVGHRQRGAVGLHRLSVAGVGLGLAEVVGVGDDRGVVGDGRPAPVNGQVRVGDDVEGLRRLAVVQPGHDLGVGRQGEGDVGSSGGGGDVGGDPVAERGEERAGRVAARIRVVVVDGVHQGRHLGLVGDADVLERDPRRQTVGQHQVCGRPEGGAHAAGGVLDAQLGRRDDEVGRHVVAGQREGDGVHLAALAGEGIVHFHVEVVDPLPGVPDVLGVEEREIEEQRLDLGGLGVGAQRHRDARRRRRRQADVG